MNVKELIKMLSDFKPEAEVLIFDADDEKMCPVMGATYTDTTVELDTSEP